MKGMKLCSKYKENYLFSSCVRKASLGGYKLQGLIVMATEISTSHHHCNYIAKPSHAK